MGWTWAMWLAQRVHIHQICLALPWATSRLVEEGAPVPEWRSDLPVLNVYCDNLVVLASTPECVVSARDA
eukprot:5916084-Pyramimonas_sp.AAC.1